MATNLSDLHEIVKSYLQTPEGRAEAKRQNVSLGYSEAEALIAARELKEAISSAFIAEQKQPNPHFNDKGVTVKLSKRTDDGGFIIFISYSPKTLRRASLYNESGFTGKGINDIFSLFTSGYSAKKVVRGKWWDSDSGKIKYDDQLIKTPFNYPSHNFITRVIRKFKQTYPGITVKYPGEWKSR